MRAHILQHVPFEGSGRIGPRLRADGYDLARTSLYAGEALPSVEEVDFLVVMGGPMSVNEEEAYPWLVEEKRFLRAYVESGRPVLGVCLGAQLIAAAAGAKVFSGPEKEIGWFPVEGVSSKVPGVFRFPERVEVFHWHGETFELPPGAAHLARSAGCAHQAFQLGGSAIGLQFHVETTPETAAALVENCRDELEPSRFVQTEEEILSAPPEAYDRIHEVMDEVISFLQRGGAA